MKEIVLCMLIWCATILSGGPTGSSFIDKDKLCWSGIKQVLDRARTFSVQPFFLYLVMSANSMLCLKLLRESALQMAVSLFFFSFLIGEGQYYFLTQFVNKTLVVDNLIYPKFGWFPIVMILVKHGQYLLFLSDFIVHSQAIWEISLITRSETLVLCNFIFHSFWPYGCVSFINMALT